MCCPHACTAEWSCTVVRFKRVEVKEGLRCVCAKDLYRSVRWSRAADGIEVAYFVCNLVHASLNFDDRTCKLWRLMKWSVNIWLDVGMDGRKKRNPQTQVTRALRHTFLRQKVMRVTSTLFYRQLRDYDSKEGATVYCLFKAPPNSNWDVFKGLQKHPRKCLNSVYFLIINLNCYTLLFRSIVKHGLNCWKHTKHSTLRSVYVLPALEK